MADAIRILVTLAEHADPRLVEQAFQDDPSLEVVGYADYFDDWREFLEQPADAARPGKRRLDRLSSRHLRVVAFDVGRRDRRHPAGVHPRGHRDDRRLD